MPRVRLVWLCARDGGQILVTRRSNRCLIPRIVFDEAVRHYQRNTELRFMRKPFPRSGAKQIIDCQQT